MKNRSKNLKILGACCLVCLLQLARAEADSTMTARKAIQARYDFLNAAAARKNLKAIMAVHSKNSEIVEKNERTANRAEMGRTLVQWFAVAQNIKGRTTVLRFHRKGRTATAFTRTRMDFEVKEPGVAKLHKLTRITTFKDTWTQSGSQWLRRRGLRLSSRQTMDGRVVTSR